MLTGPKNKRSKSVLEKKKGKKKATSKKKGTCISSSMHFSHLSFISSNVYPLFLILGKQAKSAKDNTELRQDPWELIVSAKDNPEFGQDPEEFIVRQMAHFFFSNSAGELHIISLR